MQNNPEHTARIAIFPGSFNPFTTGHLSIVERALSLFDHIIIAIGYNEHKTDCADIEQRLQDISRIFAAVPNVSVEAYSGLTADYARSKNVRFILRGVRSNIDFEYERNMADVNRMISGVETVLLYALPELASVSSSMVRELMHNGADVSRFLPQPLTPTQSGSQI